MNLEEIKKNYDLKNGLKENIIEEQREKYGKNELEDKKQKSLIVRFLAQFSDVLIIILILAAIISLIVDINEWIESLIIFFVVILNAVLGIIQESKAEKSLEALKKMSQPKTKVIRDSILKEINSDEIVVGDLITFEAGDYISADARIIDSSELRIDESSLTGESVPVEKNNKDILENVALGDKKNMVFNSTLVTNGKGMAVVTNVGMNTEIGKIAKQLSETKETLTPLQNKLTQVGKIIGILCLVICAIVFCFELIVALRVNGTVTLEDSLNALKQSIALAVAAIPEGLAAVVTVILSIGVQKMVKNNAICKKLPAVETLGSCNVICSDKTGTLTLNKMTVLEIYIDKLKKVEDSEQKEKELLNLFAICSDAKIEGDSRFGDPTELALLDANINYGLNNINIEKILEKPFDSDRKMMSVVIKKDNKFIAITKGAPDIIIQKATNKEDLKNAINANKEMSNKALRVLALAIKEYDQLPNIDELENDFKFVGLIGMIDPARKEVKPAIEMCKKAGINTVMITGDHIATASAIAKDLGILDETKRAVSQEELNNMSDEYLKENIKDLAVFARVAPSDKVRIVKAWQENEAVVAMTGDGVNDAPALKKADIGCAMGITGTDVSKQAADIILTDDNFTTIVESVKRGRGIYENIQKCVKFLLSSNIGEVITIFTVSLISLIFSINFGEPLLAIHLLWINLITDSLPAFALGMEDASDDVMLKKPRAKNESFFKDKMGLKIAFEGLVIGLLTVCAYLIGSQIEHNSDLGHTMAFMTLATTELFHAYNTKSDHTIFSKHTFNNKLLNIAFIIGFILQISLLYIPGLNDAFKLAPLDIINFLIVIGLSFSIVIVMEIYKLINFIRNKKRS